MQFGELIGHFSRLEDLLMPLDLQVSSSQDFPRFLTAPPSGGEKILTREALKFLYELEKSFGPTREKLLEKRIERQREFDEGLLPKFRSDTRSVREKDWKVAQVPDELLDRRVEITGPVDKKMIINGLNSGAQVFMADFEDSNSPTWENCLKGQFNLKEAVSGSLKIETSEKTYQLNEKTAVLFVRPRGLHLVENICTFHGKPVPASLFDFGLFFFHNAQTLLKKGSGPYFYLPKLESYEEARLWNDIFLFSQERLGLPKGTIKATVLIETITAAFEMDEILWELREHSAGLNCGRWDYIFSFIKKFRAHSNFMMPDRNEVSMERHFLKSYVNLLIQTCHRRGAHAMGGMAAQIPIKNDTAANEQAMERVRVDKVREVQAGHDGTWVAHPALVSLAREVFSTHMEGPNQRGNIKHDVAVTERDLLAVPDGKISEAGLRNNLSVSLQYLAAWLSGKGCVPINHLMEDAATAEICRCQVWQWIRHGAILDDGRKVTLVLAEKILDQEFEKIRNQGPFFDLQKDVLHNAREVLLSLLCEDKPSEFLTLKAYDKLQNIGG